MDDTAPGARNDAAIGEAIGVLAPLFGARLQRGAAVRAQHAHTTTWIASQPPDAVIFPGSTAEVAEIVRICARFGAPVIPFGAGTSLEGHVNAPAGGVCVDLSRMDRILAVNAADQDCIIEPGVATRGSSFRSTRVPMRHWAAWPRRAPRARMPSAMAR